MQSGTYIMPNGEKHKHNNKSLIPNLIFGNKISYKSYSIEIWSRC